MHTRTVGSIVSAVGFLVLLAGPVAAQNGVLTGRLIDAETDGPVAQAQIQILGGGQSRGSTSNAQGRYQADLTPGTYDLVVQVLGYVGVRLDNVGVSAGETTEYDIILTPVVLALDGIVVSASRSTPEKATEAPATTYIVSSVEIGERVTPTMADHLRSAPGVDVITTGLQGTNVVVRGFNNIFSGSLHMLTDYRLAGVPSLRVNQMHWIPATDEDIDKMEVVLGPGSALYGPNTANGIVHVLTKSPLTSTGTSVTLGGGERSVRQASFRSAFLLGDDFGFKVSGGYLSGQEWEYLDPTEQAARTAANSNPSACIGDRLGRGLNAATAQDACNRLGIRDNDIKRLSFEMRADWQFAEDGTFVATYGRTDATGIEMTGLGAGQAENWIYEFYQARFNKGRFFAQAYYNRNDAGGSYLLRDGTPLTDQSTLFVAQAQHGFSFLDDVQDFTFGVDYYATRPQSLGTIYGSYDANDDLNEWGAYVQSKTALSSRLDLIVAGRMDAHSVLADNVWSPRAALVFRPEESQSLRFTYNRAFSTPSTLNLFLDIPGGFAPAPLGPMGYGTRAFGTGTNGYSFQKPDGSLRGMRSPFNPGGAGQLLPVDPSILWPMAVGVMAAQGAINATTAGLLNSLSPTAADIGLMLLNPLTMALVPAAGSVLPDVDPLLESYTETFEVGWTGVLNNRVAVSADVYRMKKNNFVSPLILQTPMITLNGQDVGAFMAGPVGTAVATQLIMDGMDPATAAAKAAATVTALATGIAQIPLAVVSSDQVAAQGADLILAYRNVGDVTLWGADLSVQAFLTDEWTLSGTYSHISEDYFSIVGGAPIALNSPKDKGSGMLAYRNLSSGFSASGRVRITSLFPAESAGFVGTKCITGGTGGIFEEDCVASSTIFDLTAGYKVPDTRAAVQLSVNNIFDTGYRSFVGVPSIGRFAMMRVKYDLF
jgi:outer membrane receptor for ferrienterochelin and colicins